MKKQYKNTELSNEQYHATSDLSSSHIAVYYDDPFKYWNRFINKADVSENESAFLLGSLVHTLVLEPDLFDNRYAVSPVCDRRTKEGKAKWAEFLDSTVGKEVVKPEMSQEAHRIASGVFRNKYVMEIIKDKRTLFEHSYFVNGLKCRCDAITIDDDAKELTIWDLKTTQSVSKRKFEYSVRDFHYDVKAGFYAHVVEHFYPNYQINFAFIAVDKTPEANCTIFELPHHILHQRINEAAHLAKELKEAVTHSDVERFVTTVPKHAVLFED